MRACHGLVFLLVLVAAGTIVAEEQALPDLVEAVRPAVATLETCDAAGEPLSQGTAFFVSTSRAVTSRHTLAGAASADLVLADGSRRRVLGVVADHEEHDIAILACQPLQDLRPLEFVSKPPRIGETVVVIGTPLGLEASVSRGIVSGYRSATHGARYLQFTAAISPGSSGSPILTMDGRVAGVVRATLRGGDALNLATPSAAVLALEESPRIGLAAWWQATSPALRQAERAYASGVARMEAGDVTEAIEAFREAVRLDPASVPAWMALADALRSAKRSEEAVHAYRKVAELDARNAEVQVRLGLLLILDLNRGNDANEAFFRAVALDPTSQHIHDLVEGTVSLTGSHERWVRLLRQRLEDSDTDWLACKYLVHAHSFDGDHESTLQHAKRWVELRPQDVEAAQSLAWSLAKLGMREAALRTLEREATLPDPPLDATLTQTSERVTELLRNHRRMNRLMRRADIFAELGRLSEASDVLEEAVGLAVPFSSDCRAQLGLVYARRGLAERSAAEFAAALEVAPTGWQKAGVLMDRGRAFRTLRQPREAVESFREAARLDPDQAGTAWEEIGRTRLQNQRHGAAIEAYERARSLAGEFPSPLALYELALCYLEHGQRTDAVRLHAELGALSHRAKLVGTGIPREASQLAKKLFDAIYAR